MINYTLVGGEGSVSAIPRSPVRADPVAPPMGPHRILLRVQNDERGTPPT